MSTSLDTAANFAKLQATQDATKFNECTSAQGFGLMHYVFFNDKFRKQLSLPPTSKYGDLFLRIALSGNFILSVKRVSLGTNTLFENDIHFNRPEWDIENCRYNNRTIEIMPFIKSRLEDDHYLYSSPGMLMGMHNAASTTFTLAAVGYRQSEDYTVKTLRSSDDSMTVYAAPTSDHAHDAIINEWRSLKLIGVNISDTKSFIFKYGYGECTSWYQDGEFVSQYGVETATLRPQGKNPADDFYSVAKSAAVAQTRLDINMVLKPK